MTPAINLAKKNKIKYIVHEYDHDTSVQSYGLEASEKLGIDEKRVFKTLVVSLYDNSLVVAVIPVANMLNMKQIAKAFKAKKCTLADKFDVERTTGYIVGGVSPLGQKKLLKTVIDDSAQEFETIFISGGRRGLDIELNPLDLQTLTNAIFENVTQ